MSRGNFHAAAGVLAPPILALIALAAAAMWSSCDDGESEGGLDKYFLRDVAAMEELGLPVYWLGREFNPGGLTFQGPYGVGFGGEVEGGGIHMTYVLEGGNTPVDLTIYSPDAWGLVEDRMLNSPAPGVTRRVVSVQDRDGVLLLQAAGARPLNAIWLILDLGDVVVVANTNSGGAVSPGGPDYNPIINNPDLLIQVMQDLRPYPQ